MNRYKSYHEHLGHPSLVVVAKATRNSDDSVDNVTTPVTCPTPDGALFLRSTRDMGSRLVAKQPHHKLPLKMILSEVARRGEDNSITAAIPGIDQQPRSSSIIDDIFAKPPEIDPSVSRLDSLIHPRDLGKNRKRKATQNLINKNTKRDAEIIKTHCSKFYKSQNMINTKRSCAFEEDPLIPLENNLPKERASNSSPYSSASYRSVTPDSLSLNNMISGQHINSNIQAGHLSTPFAKLRFQNLYGNEFNKQSQWSQDNEAPSTSARKPFNYVDINKQKEEHNVIEPKQASPQVQAYSQKTAPVRQLSSFSSYDNFLHTVDICEKTRRVSREDFVWQPKYYKAGSETLKQMSSDDLLGSIDEGDEDNYFLVSNYSYELKEYNVTIDSQESEVSENQD